MSSNVIKLFNNVKQLLKKVNQKISFTKFFNNLTNRKKLKLCTGFKNMIKKTKFQNFVKFLIY